MTRPIGFLQGMSFFTGWMLPAAALAGAILGGYLVLGYDSAAYHAVAFLAIITANTYWCHRIGLLVPPPSETPLSMNQRISRSLPAAAIFLAALMAMGWYHSLYRQAQDEVDEEMWSYLDYLNFAAAEHSSVREIPWLAPVHERKGNLIILDDDGTVIGSLREGLVGKKVAEIIRKGNQPDHLYASTVNHLKNLAGQEGARFEGVYDGRYALLYHRGMNSPERTALLIFFENELYHDFYSSMFSRGIIAAMFSPLIWFFLRMAMILRSSPRCLDDAACLVPRAEE